MGSVSHADSLPGDTSCEKPHVEGDKCCCWSNKKAAEITLQDIQSVSLISETDVLTVQKADGTPALILSSGDLEEQLSGCNAPSSDGKVLEAKQIKICQQLLLSAPLDAKKQKTLSKSATFPSSMEVDVEDLSVDGCCIATMTGFQDQCSSSSSNNPFYARSVSLPASSKLISAMKGSRSQNGSPSNLKLHVKWAPDVYDPPCTSMSHTLKKNYHQRPKAKKRDSNKHKHKGRSTRGNNSEKRNANKSSINNIAEPVNPRLQAAGDSLLLNGYGKSNVEGVDYAVSNQDSKCGSSFLREALSKVHISMAEAT
ncbi:hypothetical protein Cni_G25036 [Canna indica]|uniref:Uncharacterized protein n=1 Tax=Canna indica TaxID=4628 RepID=A0AAQ3KWZ6_9LILI|nr:hypothetical protein Cni_G25036 [Canna indica]